MTQTISGREGGGSVSSDQATQRPISPRTKPSLGCVLYELAVLSASLAATEETATERRTLGEVLADGTLGTDEEVSLGAMRIGAGRAFGLEEAEGSWLRVAKSWERLDGRQVLVESVDYPLVKDGDSRLNDPTFMNTDDAPTCIEFLLVKARRDSFPFAYVNGGFTVDFTDSRYNDIGDILKLGSTTLE